MIWPWTAYRLLRHVRRTLYIYGFGDTQTYHNPALAIQAMANTLVERDSQVRAYRRTYGTLQQPLPFTGKATTLTLP